MRRKRDRVCTPSQWQSYWLDAARNTSDNKNAISTKQAASPDNGVITNTIANTTLRTTDKAVIIINSSFNIKYFSIIECVKNEDKQKASVWDAFYFTVHLIPFCTVFQSCS